MRDSVRSVAAPQATQPSEQAQYDYNKIIMIVINNNNNDNNNNNNNNINDTINNYDDNNNDIDTQFRLGLSMLRRFPANCRI